MARPRVWAVAVASVRGASVIFRRFTSVEGLVPLAALDAVLTGASLLDRREGSPGIDGLSAPCWIVLGIGLFA